MINHDQELLRKYRRKHNIPQRELAQAVGLSQTQISYYEIFKPPSQARMRELLQAIEKLAEKRKDRPDLRVQNY